MQKIALGHLGMSAREFWDITPRELYNAIEGHQEKTYQQDLQQWRRTRWQTWQLLQPHIKKDATFKITDLLELDGDPKPQIATIVDPEQAKRIAYLESKFDEVMKMEVKQKTKLN